MYKLIFPICLSMILIVSCSKDNSNNKKNEIPDCAFIGEWCQESPIEPGQCFGFGISIEFRANGEVVVINGTLQNWKSDDCKIINIYNDATGMKVAEYEVLEVTNSTLTIEIGAAPMEFIRAN